MVALFVHLDVAGLVMDDLTIKLLEIVGVDVDAFLTSLATYSV